HLRCFPFRAVRVTQVNDRSLRIDSDRNSLDRDVLALRDFFVTWSDFQLHLVDRRLKKPCAEDSCAPNRKEERCQIETDDQSYGKHTSQRGERAELALIDLVSKSDISGAIEHIFRQQMDESELLRPRILNRVNGTHQTILECRILLLNESGELRVR